MIGQNISSPTKSCFGENKIETKKFIAKIKGFPMKNENHIETRSEIQKVYKKNYWHGLKHMTDMLIYKTVSLLHFLS